MSLRISCYCQGMRIRFYAYFLSAVICVWAVQYKALGTTDALVAQQFRPQSKSKPSGANQMRPKSPKQMSTPPPQQNAKDLQSEPNEPRDSRANRREASVGLVAAAGGGLVYKFLAGPLTEIGYNVSDISQVAVSVGYGLGQDTVGSAATKINRDLKALVAQAKYRQFLFNSFNISAGFGYKTVDISAKQGIDQLGEITAQGKASALFASLALGNHWTLDSGLVIGFDWYGYAFAFAPQSSGNFKLNGSEIDLGSGTSPEKEASSGHDFALNALIGYQF